MVTITTVGYGDLTPVTVLGRTIATGLMVCGIALPSTGASSVASWLFERGTAHDEDAGRPGRANHTTELGQLTKEVTRLGAKISGSADAQGPPLPRERAGE